MSNKTLSLKVKMAFLGKLVTGKIKLISVFLKLSHANKILISL